MKRTSHFHSILIATALLATTTIAFGQQATSTAQPKRLDLGKAEYENNCATCHGMTGKGDGPSAGFVSTKVADLTGLAKGNGGVLPVTTMYGVIAGEREVRGHGSSDMPIWGREYRIKAAEHYMDTPYDPEAYVRTRILSLIEYINRLQVK